MSAFPSREVTGERDALQKVAGLMSFRKAETPGGKARIQGESLEQIHWDLVPRRIFVLEDRKRGKRGALPGETEKKRLNEAKMEDPSGLLLDG